jgi:hypothetical protein
MTHNEVGATKTKTVPVFVNRRKVELPAGPTSLTTLLEKAGFEGTAWDVLLLKGEGDPTGGTLLQGDVPVDIKAGLRFRVIPGNRTFGAGSPRRRKVPPDGLEGRA